MTVVSVLDRRLSVLGGAPYRARRVIAQDSSGLAIKLPNIVQILVSGDSNSVGLYEDGSIYPSDLQSASTCARWSYLAYAHQGNDSARWYHNDTFSWISTSAKTSTGDTLQKGSWLLYLAKALSAKIENVVFVQIGNGGTTIDYLDPQVNSSSFTSNTDWAVARFAAAADFGTMLAPIHVSYTGTNGQGNTGSIKTGYEHMMTGMRAIWPDMPVVCLTVPTGSISPWGAELTNVRNGIADYVGSDPLSRLVDVGAGSFFSGDSWPLLHIDRACGADFAARTALAIFDILGI